MSSTMLPPFTTSSVLIMMSSIGASTMTSPNPWVLTNPFGFTVGSTLGGYVGSILSNSVGSFLGPSIGAFQVNTSASYVRASMTPMAPRMMPSAEKPQKFGGADFKIWNQRMLFYLTTLSVVNFSKEDEQSAPRV